MATEERDEEQAYLTSVYREKMREICADVIKAGWTVSGMSTEEKNWAMRIIDETIPTAEIIKANRLETVKAARRIIKEEETD